MKKNYEYKTLFEDAVLPDQKKKIVYFHIFMQVHPVHPTTLKISPFDYTIQCQCTDLKHKRI